MKNKLRITAILLILGLALFLGGCGWSGCNYPSYGYNHTGIQENHRVGNYAY